ncbi:TetR family transcriptional regulator [Yinghuangia aomiensis]|uniref:TetR family transcriptional regulator n=1 Tax=Yinghuangia aomiensis TaxID=676205 RepID=A0ABP9GNS6_9ACTN
MAAPTTSAGTVRMTADERRASVIRAAMSEFARGGLHGTSTAAIAKRVGVSQPYLFRLFDDKKALFLATVDYCFTRLRDSFDRAVEGLEGAGAMHAMAHAYTDLLGTEPEFLRMQLQAYVASQDPEYQAPIRACWERLDEQVRVLSGAEGEELTDFFARGMLCNVIAALDLPRERYFSSMKAGAQHVDCARCAAEAAGPPGTSAESC